MANHPYNLHREQQVAHRRVNTVLKGEPAGAKQHAAGSAFSKVTSKSAAQGHDDAVSGKRGAKRFARGGNVKYADGGETPSSDARSFGPTGKERIGADGKVSGFARGGKVKGGGHHTNINIVVPGGGAKPPMPMPAGPPMGGLPPPPMGGPPGLPPGGPPPGMPMRASGGRVNDKDTWGRNTAKERYARGGAATGVGREEKAAKMKRK